MRERIQKVLSRQGVASRRETESLIKQGRVRVNGQVAILGSVITHKDLIELDKQILQEKITTNKKHMIDLIQKIENVVSKIEGEG